nr:pilus assembly protein TadG-related protein [Rugamonas brunnea]
MPRRYAWKRNRSCQRGAIAIMFALLTIVLIGFFGLALDLGQVYNRRIELRNIAAGAALAAAKELNGTAAGVTKALTKAASITSKLSYQYNQQSLSWNDAAIAFSSTADGPWLDAGAAQGAPDGLLFAKVDTSGFDVSVGTVNLLFMKVLSSAFASTTTVNQTIAGRSSILITPLAICALSTTPAASRSNPGPPANTELVEFGFRRGVSYDLMNLNPNGTTAENFVIDPLDPPGVLGAASNTWPATVGPFVCTGALAIPRVMGGTITVGRPFPLASLVNQLNARFDQYVGNQCSPNGAPPDSNVKSYPYTAIPWMTTIPGQQGALSTTSGSKLWTIADPAPAPGTNIAPNYGPLWAYARAVPYSSYTTQGSPEPASGYTPFSTSAWAVLYKPGQPTANGNYPGGVTTPYKTSSSANFLAPSTQNGPGVANRRVLNVALLSCPVGGGATTTANVIGIGKFFMLVPATATSINAEFAGAVPEQYLGGQVELVP